MKTIAQAEQALAELAEQFSDWRRRRAGRHERIPAPLWDAAVALSHVLPNGRVAKALKLSATDLKNRRLAQPAPAPIQAPALEPAFIEVTPTGADWPGGPNALRVELERPDGLRLRIGHGVDAGALEVVVRAFVEAGRCSN
jgi:hypothetical protein